MIFPLSFRPDIVLQILSNATTHDKNLWMMRSAINSIILVRRVLGRVESDSSFSKHIELHNLAIMIVRLAIVLMTTSNDFLISSMVVGNFGSCESSTPWFLSLITA